MKTAKWFLMVMILGLTHAAAAGEIGIGHGIDSADNATEESTENTASDSLWQELVEWFETAGSE